MGALSFLCLTPMWKGSPFAAAIAIVMASNEENIWPVSQVLLLYTTNFAATAMMVHVCGWSYMKSFEKKEEKIPSIDWIGSPPILALIALAQAMQMVASRT